MSLDRHETWKCCIDDEDEVTIIDLGGFVPEMYYYAVRNAVLSPEGSESRRRHLT